MKAYAKDPNLCKLYNRCISESAMAMSISTEENFSVNKADGTVAMFDNVHHFLLVMSSAVND